MSRNASRPEPLLASLGLPPAFALVEQARAAIAQIASSSSCTMELRERLPGLMASTSHVWPFWLAPAGDGKALLVNGSWNLSAFALCGWYRSVHVLDLDATRAALYRDVAGRLGLSLEVSAIERDCVADQVQALGQGACALVAMQDAFDHLPQTRRRDRLAMFEAMRAAGSDEAQLALVTAGRFSLSGRTPRRSRGRPTPGAWQDLSRHWERDTAEWLYFHPDHHSATEILQPRNPVPSLRRSDWKARLLGRMGILEALLGAYAAISPRRTGDRIIDRWASTWTGRTPRGLVIADMFVREREMMFIRMEQADAGPWMVRIPLVQPALESLRRADAGALTARGIPTVGPLVPERMPVQDVAGWPISLERFSPGEPARRFIEAEGTRVRARRTVEGLLEAMADTTSRTTEIDADVFEKHWSARFDAVIATHPASADCLRRMRDALWHRLQGRRMTLVRIHGDLTPNNLFLDPATGRATGVIDWETSQPDSLPFDGIHYLVSELREREGRPWGQCAASAMAGTGLDEDARTMLMRVMKRLDIEPDLFAPLLAGYWIRGVALRQALSGGRLNPAWGAANLTAPLEVMCRLGD